MFEKLLAVEFIAVTTDPQLICLQGPKGVIIQFGMSGWIGIDLRAFEFESDNRADVRIEGLGMGKLYWEKDGLPTWLTHFDSRSEAQRLEMIRQAAAREVNRISLVQQ